MAARPVSRRSPPEPPLDWIAALASTGPILRREIIGLLRNRKAFWMAIVTVSATSLIPLFSWPPPGRLKAFTHAQAAFTTYKRVFVAALTLFVTAVTATSITSERKSGTLDLLLATHIPPAGIILGKLMSAVAYFLVLLVLTFPMPAILFLLGGFKAWEMAGTLAEMSALALLLGAAGIWASLRNSRTIRALVGAIGVGGLARTLSRTVVQAIVLAYLFSAGCLLGLSFFLGFDGRLARALGPLSGYLATAWRISQDRGMTFSRGPELLRLGFALHPVVCCPAK